MNRVTESIIVAVITGILTLIGVLVSNSKSDAVQEERIATLTAEVKKHNQVLERVYSLETKTELHEAEFKRVNHRLDDLERSEHNG